MYGTTKERAEGLAAVLNEQSDARWFNHPVQRFEVRAHSWDRFGAPLTFGVWPVWKYEERPDLGEFGGPFMTLPQAEH